MKKISFIIFFVLILFVFNYKLQSFKTLNQLDNLELVTKDLKPLLNINKITFYDSNSSSFAQFFKTKFGVAPYRLKKMESYTTKEDMVLIIDSISVKQTPYNINLFDLVYSKKEKGYHIKLIKKIK
ncbi:hypothetical protein AAFN75_12640 [Algibacter sp. AS12]|uniref:hypothetical protein n=1 Tax=Algibacter sp. AS12 TaxID=3135773 RepID=UPI00398B69A6